jgi:hypothetical protein
MEGPNRPKNTRIAEIELPTGRVSSTTTRRKEQESFLRVGWLLGMCAIVLLRG